MRACLLSSLSLDLQSKIPRRSPVPRCCIPSTVSLSYNTSAFLSTSAPIRWAKLLRQPELVERPSPKTRSGNGAPVRNVVTAERRSLLVPTGVTIRLQGLRLCKTGPRVTPLLLPEVRGKLGLTQTSWTWEMGPERRGGCVQGVSRKTESQCRRQPLRVPLIRSGWMELGLRNRKRWVK